jgi:hypothetical protein
MSFVKKKKKKIARAVSYAQDLAPAHAITTKKTGAVTARTCFAHWYFRKKVKR